MPESFGAEFEVNDRVEVIVCRDEHTRLRPGDQGTVMFTDDLGTVHCAFDNGSTLGMSYADGDRIRKLPSPK